MVVVDNTAAVHIVDWVAADSPVEDTADWVAEDSPVEGTDSWTEVDSGTD